LVEKGKAPPTTGAQAPEAFKSSRLDVAAAAPCRRESR